MLKCKLSSQALTYLGWESSIKYLGGNQIETFTLTYAHIHTETHTNMHTHACTHTHTTHTHKHTCSKTRRRVFSFAIYMTDI